MPKFPPFKNETYQDFSRKPVADKLRAALAQVRSTFGQEYDLIIGGQRLKAPETFVSYNPSNKNEVLGVFPKASAQQARQAVEVAHQAFQRWQHEPAERRAARLFKVARLMRKRRNQLNAWCILEAGKTWPEADGDVAEAIDFAEFYAREALRLSGPQKVTPFPGERPEARYIPLGVVVVIPPWNFPAAILAGMTFAALVTGNTVVLKPSSDTPGIGAQIAEIIIEAGFPDGVVDGFINSFVLFALAAFASSLLHADRARRQAQELLRDLQAAHRQLQDMRRRLRSWRSPESGTGFHAICTIRSGIASLSRSCSLKGPGA